MTTNQSLLTPQEKSFKSASKQARRSSSHPSKYQFKNTVQRATWQEWIQQYPFAWFVTLTFPYLNTSKPGAIGKLTTCVHRFERALYGKNKAGKTAHQRLSMIAFIEMHEFGGYHLHCLIQPPTDTGKSQAGRYIDLLRKMWEEVGGSFRQFDCQNVPSNEDTFRLINYLTKTMFKDIDCINITWFRARTNGR